MNKKLTIFILSAFVLTLLATSFASAYHSYDNFPRDTDRSYFTRTQTFYDYTPYGYSKTTVRHSERSTFYSYPRPAYYPYYDYPYNQQRYQGYQPRSYMMNSYYNQPRYDWNLGYYNSGY